MKRQLSVGCGCVVSPRIVAAVLGCWLLLHSPINWNALSWLEPKASCFNLHTPSPLLAWPGTQSRWPLLSNLTPKGLSVMVAYARPEDGRRQSRSRQGGRHSPNRKRSPKAGRSPRGRDPTPPRRDRSPNKKRSPRWKAKDPSPLRYRSAEREGQNRRQKKAKKPPSSPKWNYWTGATVFHGFDPQKKFLETREDESKSRMQRFFDNIQSLFGLCDSLESSNVGLYCPDAPPEDQWTAEWEEYSVLINKKVAFGAFGVTTVVKPAESGAALLWNCEPEGDWGVTNCEKSSSSGTGVKDQVFTLKYPVTRLSFFIHHKLARCGFYDAANPDYLYRPFPNVLDFGESVPRRETILIELFDRAVNFDYLRDILDNKVEHQVMPKEFVALVVMRLLYIYNLWAIILINNSFRHGDFHGGNCMLDLTQIRNSLYDYKALHRVGLNHFYIIDLDTMRFPEIDKNEEMVQFWEDEVYNSRQVTRPDSAIVGVTISIELRLNNDSTLRQLWKDGTRGLCIDDVPDITCTPQEQMDAMVKSARILWDYDQQTGGKTYAGLLPPEAIRDRFRVRCGVGSKGPLGRAASVSAIGKRRRG